MVDAPQMHFRAFYAPETTSGDTMLLVAFSPEVAQKSPKINRVFQVQNIPQTGLYLIFQVCGHPVKK